VLETKAVQSQKNKKPIKKTTDSLELELQRQMTESTDPKNKEDSWGNRAYNCVRRQQNNLHIDKAVKAYSEPFISRDWDCDFFVLTEMATKML